MKNRIWLSLAHMGGREQEFIQEAFDTNWVVPLEPNVDAFEKALAEFLGEDKQVVLSAGTAALHLGLILLGVGAGDEVIYQSFTFSASANPITYQGARPVFVDSEASTWNMGPVLLEEAIKDQLQKTGKLPKAVVPVHLYGMPGRLDEIREVARRYGIPVLEDAAEALGSEYKEQKCGTFGELAALSFNGNKRREIHGLYTALLKEVSGISVLQNPLLDFNSNFWLTCITVDQALAGCTCEDIRLALDADNIESRPLWKSMYLQPVFADAPFYGNSTSERLFDSGLCLPSGPTLTDDNIQKVVGTIKLQIA